MNSEQHLPMNGRFRLALYAFGFLSALVGSFLADDWPTAMRGFGMSLMLSAAVLTLYVQFVVLHHRLNQLWRAVMERAI